MRVDLFQVSKGRRVLREHLIARLNSRNAITWNGRRQRGRHRPTNGYYFARFRVKTPSGFTRYKRVPLRRRHGRWTKQRQFFGTEKCGLLRQVKLTRMVFGGSNRAPLGASFLVSKRTRVVVAVFRGKKRVARYVTKRASNRRIRHVRIKRGVKRRGLYRVRITVGRGAKAERATLYSRRI